MDFRFFEPWHAFLPREPGHVVACVGAGGKAALLAACARELMAADVPCRVAAGPDEEEAGVVLTAVDPAVGRPVLLPPADRPALPAETSLVLLAVGVDGVGSRAADVMAEFDAAGPRFADLDGDAPWEWDHAERVVRAHLDVLPEDLPVVLVLTGLAEQPDSIGLFACVGRLMAEPRLPIVLFGDPGTAPDSLRAVCRDE